MTFIYQCLFMNKIGSKGFNLMNQPSTGEFLRGKDNKHAVLNISERIIFPLQLLLS